MRIAVLVIGLVLDIGLFIQALAIFSLSNAIDRQDTATAGAVGVFMAFLWVVGCGLVIPAPRVAVGLFVMAALFGFAASGSYPDLAIWASISLVLAVMSYFGHRGKRTAQRKEAERDDLLRQMAISQAHLAAVASGNLVDVAAGERVLLTGRGNTCPRCRATNAPAAKFCAECGAGLSIGHATGMERAVSDPWNNPAASQRN